MVKKVKKKPETLYIYIMTYIYIIILYERKKYHSERLNIASKININKFRI